MKGKWVLLLAAALLSTWLATGLAYAQEAKGKSVVKDAGGVQVEFIAPEGGLVAGDNVFRLQLKDTKTGQPFVQNTPRVEMTMDTADKSMNHGDMSSQKPVVAELTAVKDAPGSYSGKVKLSDAGAWNAKVYVDAQRSTILGVTAAASAPNSIPVIGGVAVLAVLAAGGVFALRRKQNAVPVASAASEPV